jgi:bacterioferritin
VQEEWGYQGRHDYYTHLVNEEVAHSAGLWIILLYLNGTPDVEHLDAVAHRPRVEAQRRADLEFEREDVELLRGAIARCARSVILQHVISRST